MRNIISNIAMCSAFVFVSLNASAFSATKFELNIPQISFQNNKGAGNLQNLSIEMDGGLSQSISPQAVPRALAKVDIFRSGKTLKISSGVLGFVLQNSPNVLLKLNSFQFEKLNLKLGTPAHDIKIGVVKMDHQAIGEFNADGLAMNCHHADSTIQDIPQLVSGCLIKATISADRLEIPEMNLFWEETFSEVTPQFESSQTFNDFDMNINKGDFVMNLKLKFMPFAKVHGFGNIKVDMTAQTATVRIDKFKFGILPVTDLVMSQLKKKLPPERFRVEPPYIYIKLN